MVAARRSSGAERTEVESAARGLQNAAAYASRRGRVLRRLGERAAMILPASPEAYPGRDLELRYQPDPELFYLTGCTEPEALAVLCPTNDEAPFTLFVRPRDPEMERWTGPRLGPDEAREFFRADAAFDIAELPNRLPSIVGGADDLYFRLGAGRHEVERLVLGLVVAGRKRRQRHGRGPRAIMDPGAVLDELRLVKEAGELRALRRAAAVTIAAFREAISAIRPGAGEWEVEALLEAAFRRHGADGPGFPSIVAAGRNATVLHYNENRRRMRKGELVLLDAGARCRMYHGDVSRTFPVSGRFTAVQLAAYGAVLAARDAAIAAVRPGAAIDEVHGAAVHRLVEALADFGCLAGSVETLAADEAAYKPFFPHRTSHWLGLEVHDAGDYVAGGEPRKLRAGMVLTIEPGLYFDGDLPAPLAEFRHIGVRIEDDLVVTDAGCEVLTAGLPVDGEEVAALVR